LDKYVQAVALWQSFNIESVAELDKYLDSFCILFAFHSGRIENDEITYHDTRDIFENGKVYNYTGNPITLIELQNQKLCHGVLKEKIIRKEPLSIELIKEIHKVLTSGAYDERRYIANEERPGEFNVIGIHEVGSAVLNVESDLAELLTEINDYSGKDVLKVAAYFHAKFEYIHPFADGNGRVGRVLINYYLMTHNHPPLIVYDEDKRMYYECLQKYDEAEELKPLYEFLKYETEKTWEKAIRRASSKKEERKGLSDFAQNIQETK